MFQYTFNLLLLCFSTWVFVQEPPAPKEEKPPIKKRVTFTENIIPFK